MCASPSCVEDLKMGSSSPLIWSVPTFLDCPCVFWGWMILLSVVTLFYCLSCLKTDKGDYSSSDSSDDIDCVVSLLALKSTAFLFPVTFTTRGDNNFEPGLEGLRS